MKNFAIATALSGIAAAAVALAGAATAAPIVNSTAADAAANLQAEGYTVQFNGIQRGPLSRCMVTGVHGLDDRMSSMDVLMEMMDPAAFDTVYLDISCPNSNN